MSTEAKTAQVDLDSLPTVDLRKMAAKLKVQDYIRLKKVDLIAAIRAAAAEQGESAPDPEAIANKKIGQERAEGLKDMLSKDFLTKEEHQTAKRLKLNAFNPKEWKFDEELDQYVRVPVDEADAQEEEAPKEKSAKPAKAAKKEKKPKSDSEGKKRGPKVKEIELTPEMTDILGSEDTKTEKMQKLFGLGLKTSEVSKLVGAHYSFAFSVKKKMDAASE